MPLDLNYETGRLIAVEGGEFQGTVRTKGPGATLAVGTRMGWALGLVSADRLDISMGGGAGAGLWLPRRFDSLLCLGFRRNGDLVGFTNDKVGC